MHVKAIDILSTKLQRSYITSTNFLINCRYMQTNNEHSHDRVLLSNMEERTYTILFYRLGLIDSVYIFSGIVACEICLNMIASLQPINVYIQCIDIYVQSRCLLFKMTTKLILSKYKQFKMINMCQFQIMFLAM